MLLAAVFSVVALAGGATVDVALTKKGELQMWIDETQVSSMYQGIFHERYYVIEDSIVNPNIRDLSFGQLLPPIPAQINSVNFSWCSGTKDRYFYKFDTLQSFNTNILHDPWISIAREGEVPSEPKSFSVNISCVANASGIANLRIGFGITNSSGVTIPQMPLELDLRKECRDTTGPEYECQKKCKNGICDENEVCICKPGYMGRYCETPICFPVCMNGTCVAPGQCQCKEGFTGYSCDGGWCTTPCKNGGKCIQKDKCRCASGFYGPACEYSKCKPKCENGGTCLLVKVNDTSFDGTCLCTGGFYGTACELTKCLVQCINGGLCVGDDICQCKKSFTGKYCEKPLCKKDCVHGVCIKDNIKKNRCKCDPGWAGRRCRVKVPGKNNQNQWTKKKT